MRVLFLARLYKPHVGGVEKHIEEVIRILRYKNIKFNIITTNFNNQLPKTEVVEGVKILRFKQPKIKFIGLLYTWLWFLRNLNLIRSAEIIHIHDVFIWYLPIRLLLPRKNVFITFHGYPDYPLSKKAIILQKLAEKLTCGNVCIGRFIEKWFGTKADIVAYGAVDRKKYKPLKRRKYKYDAIFASRLDEHTGVLTYLDAIKILKQQGINFNLVVLGGGKYKNRAAKLSQALGWVDDTSAYFIDSKYAFVNRYLAILEAFASKKLVFAVYDNPLKKDYLFMTPFKDWIVIENDPKKLAEKIVYYSKHSKKAKGMIEKAYNWVKDQTWERLSNDYRKLWKISHKQSQK